MNREIATKKITLIGPRGNSAKLRKRKNKGRTRDKTKDGSRRETTLSELQSVTIWKLIDHGDGKKPRFERVTPW